MDGDSSSAYGSRPELGVCLVRQIDRSEDKHLNEGFEKKPAGRS
jgi:hypothetical protein